MREEDDKGIELDEIGSKGNQQGLADEETLEPLMEGGIVGQDHESLLKEEHQEKNSDVEQGAVDQVAEDPNELIEVELHQSEEVARLSDAVEVKASKEE